MKKILCLGHCGFDGPHLKSILSSKLDVEVELASSTSEAERMLAKQDVSLVLVNRIFDRDGDSGIAWIGKNKNSANAVPCMLVSNFSDAQSEAVKLGALPGFGKSELESPNFLASIKQAIE